VLTLLRDWLEWLRLRSCSPWSHPIWPNVVRLARNTLSLSKSQNSRLTYVRTFVLCAGHRIFYCARRWKAGRMKRGRMKRDEGKAAWKAEAVVVVKKEEASYRNWGVRKELELIKGSNRQPRLPVMWPRHFPKQIPRIHQVPSALGHREVSSTISSRKSLLIYTNVEFFSSISTSMLSSMSLIHQ